MQRIVHRLPTWETPFRAALQFIYKRKNAEEPNVTSIVRFHALTKMGLLTPFNREVYGYCSLNYQNGLLSFVFEDKEYGILYADLTPFMDEILTKMIANQILYEQDHSKSKVQ